MFPELLSFPNCYLGAFFLLLVRTLPGNAFKAALAGFFCNGNNKPLLRSLEGATAATAKAFLQKRFAVTAIAFFCNGKHVLLLSPKEGAAVQAQGFAEEGA